MLKINRNVNFDPAVVSIVYTSIDGYFELTRDLDNSDLNDVIFIIIDD